ncbi:MAG TPA: GNAT family N-acetyltransferase [Anaerolineales bacterium]|nr:GNAT family N-acetyltransferase [Anaerolineales bacterium]
MMVESSPVYQLTLRYALAKDLPALEWEGEFTHFRRIFSEAFHQSEQGKAILWVAEVPGEGILGQLFVQIDSESSPKRDGRKRAYIYGFRVRPVYRGLGIGSRMLQTAELDLARRGFRRICLNVSRENRDARRLYESFGYRVVSAEPGVWSYLDEKGIRRHVNEPAWRMEKDL